MRPLASLVLAPGALLLGIIASPAHAETYAIDLVAPASTGVDMNEAADVVGTMYVDDGCGSWCLPDQETVVWVDDDALVLPTHPSLTGITVTGINSDGWVAGYAGMDGTITEAVVWIPSGGTYTMTRLGALPGMDSSTATGIDDTGRVVGWSSEITWLGDAAPFVWTEASGMEDLSAAGFPDEEILAISPGGTVATQNYWYTLDDPDTVSELSDPPRGYLVGTYGTVINDAGTQARFLVSTSSESLIYPFRYETDGTWQQLSSLGTGSMSRAGLGSINDAGDVVGTIQSAAFIAYGPEGEAEALGTMLSPAYPGAVLTGAGTQNAAGEILASVSIGQSDRVVRLEPVDACTSNCVRVPNLYIRSTFVEDPSDPGRCTRVGTAYNDTQVVLRVTRGRGRPAAGAVVEGRFLDDYWTHERVTATTDARGLARFRYEGLCGVGAIAFIVDEVTWGTATLDRTVGTLMGSDVPS